METLSSTEFSGYQKIEKFQAIKTLKEIEQELPDIFLKAIEDYILHLRDRDHYIYPGQKFFKPVSDYIYEINNIKAHPAIIENITDAVDSTIKYINPNLNANNTDKDALGTMGSKMVFIKGWSASAASIKTAEDSEGGVSMDEVRESLRAFRSKNKAKIEKAIGEKAPNSLTYPHSNVDEIRSIWIDEFLPELLATVETSFKKTA